MNWAKISTVITGLSCLGGCIKSFIFPYKGEPRMDGLKKALFDDIATIIASLQAKYQELNADGTIDIKDAWVLLQLGIADLVKIADEFNVPAADKRALLLEAAESLYTSFVEPLEVKNLPPLLEPIADRIIHPIFTALMTNLINSLIPA